MVHELVGVLTAWETQNKWWLGVRKPSEPINLRFFSGILGIEEKREIWLKATVNEIVELIEKFMNLDLQFSDTPACVEI